MRGGRATAIQTWRPEDERKVEIVQEILNHLIAIRKQDGTTDMLMTLAGAWLLAKRRAALSKGNPLERL